jgi:nucleoside-diphosphate-sugar epimerase
MRILITGGTGFIGSHLGKILEQESLGTGLHFLINDYSEIKSFSANFCKKVYLSD